MNTEKQTLEMKYDSDYLVIQANELVRSKQDELTLLEAKIIRLAISQVLKEDTDLKTYTCDSLALASFLSLDRSNIYRDIVKLSKSLMKKSIFIKDTSNPSKKGKENFKIFNWVEYIEYKDGIITLKLSESLKPYLIGLDKLFTAYSYDAVLNLPTNYSIRMYELLSSYQNIAIRGKDLEQRKRVTGLAANEVLFTIDYLREYFDCIKKYPNSGDFMKNVIKQSVDSINKNTLMRVSYKAVKRHRAIAQVIFSFDQLSNEKLHSTAATPKDAAPEK